MSILNVGAGQQYSTISSAVATANSGDTVNVQAGTYTSDFPQISKSLTLQAVGGTVNMVATQEPPNGKGIIDEGGPGVNVTIQGFDISGAQVSDGNGAGVRYEGGNLTLKNVTIHGNQDGLLSNPDPNGNITISNSHFYSNGSGSGATHDIYVGDIDSLWVLDNTIESANVGHEIKSRAANTTISGNMIKDGPNGTSSYEIDLPNGGNATITGNVIEKGANAQNPHAISFGEEGNVHPSSSLKVSGNAMINDDPSQSSTGVQNDTGVTAVVTGNKVYGWNTLVSGSANVSQNTTLAAEPALSSLAPNSASGAVNADAGTPAPGGTAAAGGKVGTDASTPPPSNATAASGTPSTDAGTPSTDPGTPAPGDATAASGTTDTSGTTASSTDVGSAPINAGTVDTSTSTPSFASGDAGSPTQASPSTPVGPDPTSTPAASTCAGGDQVASTVTQAQTTPPAVGTAPAENYAMGSTNIAPGWHHTWDHDSSAWHSLYASSHSDGHSH